MSTLTITNLRDLFEERKRAILTALAAVAALLVITIGLLAWIGRGVKQPPSIFDHPVDDALGYLALPDFNKLPLEDRLKFLMDLADRFRALQPSESAAAAAFLAGVVGPTREQLTQNFRLMAKDILASGASEYMNLPEDQRGKFIDDFAVKWMKMGERLVDGKESNKSDEERLGDIHKDVKRQRERAAARTGTSELTDRSATRMMDLWQGEVEKASTPKEQGQISYFMDGMRKHFAK